MRTVIELGGCFLLGSLLALWLWLRQRERDK